MHTIKQGPFFHSYLDELLEVPVETLTLPSFQSALLALNSKINRTDLEIVNQLGRDAIDVCGTGGSGVSKFNTSTTVAFVLASLGVKVTKFGSRSQTGRMGSVDLLQELGFTRELHGLEYERVFNSTGLVFLNAQSFFPQLAEIREKRRAVGHATIFNYLGPLLNPAKPSFRLLGVSDPYMQTLLNEYLQKDGSTVRAMTVRSGRVDELLPFGINSISLMHRGGISEFELESRMQAPGKQPLDAPSRDLEGQSQSANPTKIFHAIINGDDVSSEESQTVILNAAAALIVKGLAANLEDGQTAVRQTLIRGAAARKFEEVRRFYQ